MNPLLSHSRFPIGAALLALMLAWHTGPSTGQGQPTADTEDAAAGRGDASPDATGPADQPSPDTDLSGEPTAVRLLLDSNPQTAFELLRAVDLLVQLDRPALAKGFLERLVSMPITDDQLAQLHDRFGTPTLLRLSAARELSPTSTQFARRMLEAAGKHRHDAQRLAQFAQQLASQDRLERKRAAAMLLRAGPHSVRALIQVFDPADERLRRATSELLGILGRDAVEPLAGYMASPDVKIRERAIRLLGDTLRRDALPYLVRPLFAPAADSNEALLARQAWRRIAGDLPDRGESVALLSALAEHAYRHQPVARADDEGMVTIWVWDGEQQASTPTRLLAEDAQALVAARHYRDLYWLTPDSDQFTERYLIARLQLEQALVGLDAKISGEQSAAYALAERLTPQQILHAIDVALKDGYPWAALAGTRWLTDRGSMGLFAVPTASDTLLALLTHPDHRIGFAACEMIVAWEPDGSFVGFSRLMDRLAYVAASAGKRSALVAHVRKGPSQRLAGMLSEMGFAGRSITGGLGPLLEASAVDPDLELIVLREPLEQTTLWDVLEELRAHPATHLVPVLIITTAEQLDDAEHLASQHDRTIVAVAPSTLAVFRREVATALPLAGRHKTAASQRLNDAAMALKWITDLLPRTAQASIDIHSVQRPATEALYVPTSSRNAAELLSHLPTPTAQKALASFATQFRVDAPLRRGAVESLLKSTRRYGLLLTGTDVRQLRHRAEALNQMETEADALIAQRLLDALRGKPAAELSAPSEDNDGLPL